MVRLCEDVECIERERADVGSLKLWEFYDARLEFGVKDRGNLGLVDITPTRRLSEILSLMSTKHLVGCS